MFRICVMAIVVTFATISSAAEVNLRDLVKYDNNCVGATLLELRVTDCVKFPCVVHRGKNYTVDAEFIMVKDVKNPVVKCGTIYLGRQYSLPGHGGCETITNGTCPLSNNVVYNTMTGFNIPYYVPPILYTISCRLEDDDGNCLLGGSGSGRVV